MFIGQLGTAQLAAVPFAGGMYLVGLVFFTGIVRTSIAFMGRAFGAKEYQKIGTILAHYQWLALILFPLLFLFIQAWPFFSALAGLDAAVDGYAWLYLKIRVWDAIFYLLLILYSTFYMSLGNSRFPMLVGFIVFPVNVILDYGLIFGKFGLPAMGVAGSALATVLAIVFSTLIMVGYSFLSANRARFGLRVFAPLDMGLLKKILRVGVPQGVGDWSDMLTGLIFWVILAQLGQVSLAASHIGFPVTQFLFLPAMAVGAATASYVGRFLGANRPELARAATSRSLTLSITYMGLLGIPLWFFGEFFASWFSTDVMVIYQAGLMFQIIALHQVFEAVGIILNDALSGAGDTLVPTLLQVGTSVVILFPLAILLSQMMEPGLVGAWVGSLIHAIVYAIAIWYRYSSNKWTVTLQT